jgi:hypothetical protein
MVESFVETDRPRLDPRLINALRSHRSATRAAVPLDTTFDGGVLTSDGELPLPVEADHQQGSCGTFAS